MVAYKFSCLLCGKDHTEDNGCTVENRTMATEHTVDDSEQMMCDRFRGEQCPECRFYDECDLSFDDCQLNPANQIEAAMDSINAYCDREDRKRQNRS